MFHRLERRPLRDKLDLSPETAYNPTRPSSVADSATGDSAMSKDWGTTLDAQLPGMTLTDYCRARWYELGEVNTTRTALALRSSMRDENQRGLIGAVVFVAAVKLSPKARRSAMTVHVGQCVVGQGRCESCGNQLGDYHGEYCGHSQSALAELGA
jgi:hypothetical protein